MTWRPLWLNDIGKALVRWGVNILLTPLLLAVIVYRWFHHEPQSRPDLYQSIPRTCVMQDWKWWLKHAKWHGYGDLLGKDYLDEPVSRARYSGRRENMELDPSELKRIARMTPITRFPRLFDLPPEIRERVYAYYFEYWNVQRIKDRPIPPVDPPLTRASRILRVEALPVFYDTHRFPLITHFTSDPCFRQQQPDRALTWYDCASPQKLQRITQFELYACTTWSASIFIDLDTKTRSYRTSMSSRHDVYSELQAIFLVRTRFVLDQVIRREMPLQLTVTELEKLVTLYFGKQTV